MIDTARIVHEYKNRIWIEDDLWGDRHVMIQGEWRALANELVQP